MVSLRGMVVNGLDKENDFYIVVISILIVNFIIISWFRFCVMIGCVDDLFV